MTDTCKPSGGTEENSLHWVEHPRMGKRIWKWGRIKHYDGNLGDFVWGLGGPLKHPDDAHAMGWRYLGPAFPNDATELAEALSEIERLREVGRAKNDVHRDHVGQMQAQHKQELDLYGARINALETACDKLCSWMSAAQEDPDVCAEMKSCIEEWFDIIGRRKP